MASRKIVCETCAPKRLPMHPEDVANGFQRRCVELRARRPEGHGVRIGGEFFPSRSLVCDDCGQAIADGARVMAITMWRDIEPGPWEEDYKA